VEKGACGECASPAPPQEISRYGDCVIIKLYKFFDNRILEAKRLKMLQSDVNMIEAFEGEAQWHIDTVTVIRWN
jgi:hypothetical protein